MEGCGGEEIQGVRFIDVIPWWCEKKGWRGVEGEERQGECVGNAESKGARGLGHEGLRAPARRSTPQRRLRPFGPVT
jgi:hypothetical protein